MNQKEIKKYLKKVKLLIICDFATRRKFIGDLKNNILDYSETNDVQSIDDVYKQFGTPEDIAKAFFQDIDIKKVKMKMNFTRVILIAVIIALALWAGGIVTAVIDNHDQMTGYTVEHFYDVDENGNQIGEDVTRIYNGIQEK